MVEQKTRRRYGGLCWSFIHEGCVDTKTCTPSKNLVVLPSSPELLCCGALTSPLLMLPGVCSAHAMQV